MKNQEALDRWYKDAVAIVIITVISTIVPSNGFQFGKVFFPADILAEFSAWHSIAHRDFQVRNPLLTDPILEFEPWEELIRTAGSERRWPLWNPYSFMGSPLLGNGQISAFTVFSMPLHFLPVIPAHFLEAFLKLWIAGLGMYFLGRALLLGRTASVVSGLVFMLSGHMIAWLHFPLSGGLALAPLLLLASERLLQKTSRVWFCVIVVSIAMLALCGQPQTTLAVGTLLVAFSIHRSLHYWRVDSNTSGWRRRVRWLASGVVLGIGLSSFQSLPFIEYLYQSAAQTERNAYNVFFLPLYQLITLLLPDFFGNAAHGNYWGYANNVGPAIYIGVVPLFLAIAAVVLGRREANTIFFGATALVSLVIVTKQLGVERLFEIPILAGITINKFIAPFTLSMAFLAGKGIDLFWVRPKAVLKLCTFLLALSGIYVVSTAAYFWRWLTELNLTYYELARGIPLFVLTPAAILALWLWYRRSRASGSLQSARVLLVPACVFILAAAVDPIYCWLNFNPSVESRFFYPISQGIEFLKKDQEVWRLMSIGQSLPPNTSSYFHLQDSLGYDGMTYRRYYDFMSMVDSRFQDLAAALEVEKLASKPWNPRTRLFDEYVLDLLRSKGDGFVPYLKQANYWNYDIRKFDNRRLLDLMNVKYVVTPPSWSPDATIKGLTLIYDEDVRVYSNDTALPRAFLLHQWSWADSDKDAMGLMSQPQFDPAATAILQRVAGSKDAGPAFISKATDENQAGSAKILSYQNEKVVLEADTGSDAILLLSDVYYPGWKCTVDGKETEVFISDFLFRGIHLVPGKHEVVFYYRPSSFVWGLRLSLIAALVTVLSMVWMHLPGKSTSRTSPQSPGVFT